MKIITENLPNLRTVIVALATKHGSSYDEISGLTSVLIPTLIRGTKKHTEEHLNLLIDGKGSEFLYFIKKDYCVLGLRCTPEEVDNSLSLLFEIITEPIIEESIFEVEKQNLIQKVKQELDNPLSRLVGFTIDKAVFGEEHPYGRPVNGFPETIEKLSREMAIKLLENGFFVDPIGIILGNLEALDRNQLVESFQSYINSIPFRVLEKPTNLPKVNVQPMNIYCTETKQAKNTYIALNCIGELEHRDYIMTQYAAALLGQTPNSRMFKSIRDEKGLSYITITSPNFIGELGYFSTIIDVNHQRVEEAISELVYTMQNLADNGVEEEECQAVKEFLTAMLDSKFDRTKSLVATLIDSIYHGGPKNFEEFYESIENITSQNFHNWYKKNFKRENLSLAIEGNASYEEIDQYLKKTMFGCLYDGKI
ncbi:MAG: M16 family metallopeptidase [Candidatus Heimdallarchaeaceae archaeon]